MMALLVQIFQGFSGAMWFIAAILLLPRIIASWRAGADKLTVVSARNGWLAFLMVGFSIRWFVWPHSIGGMVEAELIAWSALYAMSGLLAFWFFTGALQNRGR